LFQRNQYISLDYSRQDVKVIRLQKNPQGGIPEVVNDRLTPEKKEPLYAELDSFLKAVCGVQPVQCTGNEGRRALELALQILAQAEKAQALEFDRS
jgi:predicted dehydrogenase